MHRSEKIAYHENISVENLHCYILYIYDLYFQFDSISSSEIFEIQKLVKACNNSSVCLKELAVQIEDAITVSPDLIRKESRNAVDLARSNEPLIRKCGNDSVEAYKTGGRKLTNVIVTCVDNKIPH